MSYLDSINGQNAPTRDLSDLAFHVSATPDDPDAVNALLAALIEGIGDEYEARLFLEEWSDATYEYAAGEIHIAWRFWRAAKEGAK